MNLYILYNKYIMVRWLDDNNINTNYNIYKIVSVTNYNATQKINLPKNNQMAIKKI